LKQRSSKLTYQGAPIFFFRHIDQNSKGIFQLISQASKKAFTSTLSILIFLFNVSKIPPEEIVNNREKSLSIGLNFKLTNDPKIEKDPNGQVLVESKDIPLSKSAILLLLIVWQISMFGFSARKIANEE